MKNASCESCVNCYPIGGGDHICGIADSSRALVIDEYVPTENYMYCDCVFFEEMG